MKKLIVSHAGIAALAMFTAGCGGSDAPKIPLGAAKATAETPGNPPMSGPTGEARVALDSGNVLFRAKDYDQALVQYQRSAELAPNEVAPLMGIMMVADVTKNVKLAEDTRPRLRKLSAELADSAEPHSKIIRGHPPIGTPPTT